MHARAQLAEEGTEVMNLDCADLAEGDPVLYQQLVRYPAEVVVLLDQEAHTIWAHFAGASPDAGPQFTARHLDLCFCLSAVRAYSMLSRPLICLKMSEAAYQARVQPQTPQRAGRADAGCADQTVQPAGDKGDPGPAARGHQPAGVCQRHGDALQQRHPRDAVRTTHR